MASGKTFDDFRTILSIDPLLDFWREKVAPKCPHMAEMFRVFEKKIQDIPALKGDIDHPEDLPGTHDILSPLMSVAFPSSTWDTEISAAFTPFQHQVIYGTPAYHELLFDGSGKIAGRLKGQDNTLDFQRVVRAYALILKRLYGIEQGIDSPLIRIVTDPITGLERHFQITPDFQFVQVRHRGQAAER
jgi:hypothetical protein